MTAIYHRIATAERRDFRVTVGTQRGYSVNAVSTPVEVGKRLIQNWIRARINKNLPYLTGVCGEGEVVYGWQDEGGVAQARSERCLVFSGVLSSSHDASMTDDTAVECLESLASKLGSAFGQTRVYLEFRGETWVLQEENSSTPRTTEKASN